MRIDHLVWYNADLTQGYRYFSDKMDCDPLYGGQHPGEATANAVMALGPSTYLEILGLDVKQSGAGLDPEVRGLQGSGLFHWAVGGVDLARISALAARGGLEGGAIVPGGRITPDGKRLEWECWGLHNHAFGSLIPFFINWQNSEHPAVAAPLGGTLASFEVHSPGVEQLRSVFRILELDIPVVESAMARVVAKLKSAKGLTELASFIPLPQGYVI